MKFKINDILITNDEENTSAYAYTIKIVSIEDDKYTIKYLNDKNIFRYLNFVSTVEEYYRYPTDRELKLIQLKSIK